MRFLLLMSIAFSVSAFACQDAPPREQARINRADLERQAELVRDLAADSDAIFFGKVVGEGENSGAFQIKVNETLVGSVPIAETVWELPDRGLTIACRPSEMFHNVALHVGRSYIFYVRGQELLRAGWVERSPRDIPVHRERATVERVRSGT
jgi:hypothetical protein